MSVQAIIYDGADKITEYFCFKCRYLERIKTERSIASILEADRTGYFKRQKSFLERETSGGISQEKRLTNPQG